MSVVKLETLQAYLGQSTTGTDTEPVMQASLDRAETATALALGGTALNERTVSETIDIQPDFERTGNSDFPVYFLKKRRVFLSDGPATAVSAMSFVSNSNPTNILSTAVVSQTGWAVEYELSLFTYDVTVPYQDYEVTITYTAGWKDESDLPPSILQYVLAKAAVFYAVPMGGIIEVRLGDNYVTLDHAALRQHVEDLSAMLGPWRRVRL
jgi:hypothetical protein